MRNAIVLLAAVVPAALLLRQVQQPGTQAPPKNPYEAERQRIEREVEGIWAVTEFKKPGFNAILKSGGFMMAHKGWLSINAVITVRDTTFNTNFNLFVGSMKSYTISETNRLRLTDQWGFSNANKGELTPDISGTVEERDLMFTGAPEQGQCLRITRAPDDYIEFIRRAAFPVPVVPAAPTDR